MPRETWCLSCGAPTVVTTSGSLCRTCQDARDMAWKEQTPVHERIRTRMEERMADPRRVIPCPKCERRFVTEESRDQHYSDSHMVRVDV